VNERTSSIEPGRAANVPAATKPEPRAIGLPLLSRIGTAEVSAELMFKNETVKPEVCPKRNGRINSNFIILVGRHRVVDAYFKVSTCTVV